MTKCKHKWHFMRVLTSTCMRPARIDKKAQFICEKCGETKEVTLK
jgi:hypothetical protein